MRMTPAYAPPLFLAVRLSFVLSTDPVLFDTHRQVGSRRTTTADATSTLGHVSPPAHDAWQAHGHVHHTVGVRQFLDRAMTGSPCHQQTYLFTRRLAPAFSARCTRLARTTPPLIRTCSLASSPPRFVHHRVAPLRTHSHTSLRAMRRTVSPRMDLTHPNLSVLCCTTCFHVPAVLQCVQTTPDPGFSHARTHVRTTVSLLSRPVHRQSSCYFSEYLRM